MWSRRLPHHLHVAGKLEHAHTGVSRPPGVVARRFTSASTVCGRERRRGQREATLTADYDHHDVTCVPCGADGSPSFGMWRASFSMLIPVSVDLPVSWQGDLHPHRTPSAGARDGESAQTSLSQTPHLGCRAFRVHDYVVSRSHGPPHMACAAHAQQICHARSSSGLEPRHDHQLCHQPPRDELSLQQWSVLGRQLHLAPSPCTSM